MKISVKAYNTKKCREINIFCINNKDVSSTHLQRQQKEILLETICQILLEKLVFL